MSERLQALCAQLRREALVASCGVVDVHRGLVAGEGTPADALVREAALVRGQWDAAGVLGGKPSELVCSFANRSLVVRALDDAHLAFAWFDHRSSLALVRLRLRAFVGD